MDEKRGFHGVWIPREIWLNPELSLTEKCLFVEIDSLDSGPEHCWKSNESFSEFLNCSVPTVIRSIRSLKEKGFISVHSKLTKEGTLRYMKSLFRPQKATDQNDSRPTDQFDRDPQINLIKATDQNDSQVIQEFRNTNKSNTKKVPTLKTVDPLYKPIEQAFLSQGNFADYRKEGSCIKAIIKKVRNLTPDEADITALKLLETFKVLTSGNDKFWKDRPFLPSGLSPCLEQVWTIAKKGSAAPSMDWFDELERRKA